MKAHKYLKDLFQFGVNLYKGDKSHPGAARFWHKPDWKNKGIEFLNPGFGRILKEFDGLCWAFQRDVLDEDGKVVRVQGNNGRSYPLRKNWGILLYSRDEDNPQIVQDFKERLIEEFPSLEGRVCTGTDLEDAGMEDILEHIRSMRLPGAMDEYDSLQPGSCLFLCIPAMPPSVENGFWSNRVQRSSKQLTERYPADESDTEIQW